MIDSYQFTVASRATEYRTIDGWALGVDKIVDSGGITMTLSICGDDFAIDGTRTRSSSCEGRT